MLYIVLGVVVLSSISLGLYGLLTKGEAEARARRMAEELEAAREELFRLDQFKHIPDIVEKSRRLKADVGAKLEQARKQAESIIRNAEAEAQSIVQKADAEALRLIDEAAISLGEAQKRANDVLANAADLATSQTRKMTAEAEAALANARGAERIAQAQAAALIEEAEKKAREVLKDARKEAKEKTLKVEETLERATAYALEIRSKAEARAEEIAGAAYDALKRHDHYEAAAQAYRNAVDGYSGTYVVPATHILDELADEYGFHNSGERLRLARDRTRIMQKNGTAATCNYPEGWKRDYAIDFVLSAFNGKVDSILSRVKPAAQGKQIQEIKDAFALVNQNGTVFREARINPEFLDARLDEYKWAVAVQRLKDRQREEQRAIREQMREEIKAKKEYERALKQAQREEELLAKALEKARREFAEASSEEKAKYEAQIEELAAKVQEAEDNKRAIAMAQVTRTGHVYVISNVGSFGEDVFKIGLTRRIDPLERVRELGDASVPFAFDVHALLKADDAPALEAALHKKFLSMQVNKVNRRKEFFRLKLHDIRQAVEQMGLDVKWTIAAEAREYRETLTLEKAMKDNQQLRMKWLEDQEAYEDAAAFREDAEDDAEMAEAEATEAVS